MIGFSDLQADIARDLAKAGLNVLLFNQRSVDEILSMILALSSLIGKADKGAALVRDLDEGLERIREQARAFPRRLRVYFEEWDEPMISGIGWVSELVGVAGGEDVFPVRARSHAAAGRTIADPQEVVRARPDVILGSWCGKKFRPEHVIARPGWSGVPAVRDGELHEIKSAEILQPGPAALTDGVRRMHAIFAAWNSRRAA